jgi:queuine tRNA-ribosyltransferase
MGVGRPEDIVEAVRAGFDMFDCVIPTRNARNGTLYTSQGKLNIKRAEFAADPRPLDEACGCYCCVNFSRAYLRHLINQQELLGLILLSEHNVRFVHDVTAGARAAIERGELAAYKAAALDRLGEAALVPGEEIERIRGLGGS